MTAGTDVQARRPWLVIVTGLPGSGKSSLGIQLASRLRIPYLSRDDVRWGLLATAGLWTGDIADLPGRDLARQTFLDIVELVARRGVSAVLEFIVFKNRPEELERLLAVADCVVVVTECADASVRAEARERTDWLMNQPAVLEALGYDAIDDHLGAGADQREAIRAAMVTEFDLPSVRVSTEDGYDPSLDHLVGWVIDTTSR